MNDIGIEHDSAISSIQNIINLVWQENLLAHARQNCELTRGAAVEEPPDPLGVRRGQAVPAGKGVVVRDLGLRAWHLGLWPLGLLLGLGL